MNIQKNMIKSTVEYPNNINNIIKLYENVVVAHSFRLFVYRLQQAQHCNDQLRLYYKLHTYNCPNVYHSRNQWSMHTFVCLILPLRCRRLRKRAARWTAIWSQLENHQMWPNTAHWPNHRNSMVHCQSRMVRFSGLLNFIRRKKLNF